MSGQVLGGALIVAARCLALLYPKDDPRRDELVAEMTHVGSLGRVTPMLCWLGQTLGTAVSEGLPARRRVRRVRQARLTKSTKGEALMLVGVIGMILTTVIDPAQYLVMRIAGLVLLPLIAFDVMRERAARHRDRLSSGQGC